MPICTTSYVRKIRKEVEKGDLTRKKKQGEEEKKKGGGRGNTRKRD